MILRYLHSFNNVVNVSVIILLNSSLFAEFSPVAEASGLPESCPARSSSSTCLRTALAFLARLALASLAAGSVEPMMRTDKF